MRIKLDKLKIYKKARPRRGKPEQIHASKKAYDRRKDNPRINPNALLEDES